MSKARDSQRSKVYAAESVIRRYGRTKMTFAECEKYLAKVQASAWFVRHYGDHFAIRLNDRGSRAHAATSWGAAKGNINLPSWARNEAVLLHEIAHNVTKSRYGEQVPGHGWQWAGTYVELVGHFMGADVAKLLTDSFREHKVRWRQPKTRTMTDEQRAAAAARLAAYRESRQPTGPRFVWTQTVKDERGWRTGRNYWLNSIEVYVRDADGNLVEHEDRFCRVTSARDWAESRVSLHARDGGRYTVSIEGVIDDWWGEGARSEQWEGHWVNLDVETAA